MTAVLASAAPWEQSRLRTTPIPDTEPADGSLVRPVRPTPRSGNQVTLALVPLPLPLRPPTADRTGRLRSNSAVDLPDPEMWSRRIAQAVAEVLCGVRPVAQLSRWTSRDVYDGLRRRCTLAVGLPAPRRRAVVRAVRLCRPTDTVVEAAAVVLARGRLQAVAFRLEATHGRWRMTALEIG